MNKKSVLKKSLELFELEKIDRDIFSWNGKNVGYKRIFGGQVMAQTLIAAYKTIDVEHFAHSYHSYFLRPGDMDKSITFTVDRIRDGKSFTTRSVKAIQEGEVIFNCSISFQKREKGLEHQIEMPDVPEPESLKSEQEIREEILKELNMKKEEIQQAFLLYISDMGLLGAANNSVGVNFLTKNLQNASLDHAMWFHRKLDLDGWFLYSIDSPVTRNARGFSRGSIFSRDGKLIASCTQEGLIRLWEN